MPMKKRTPSRGRPPGRRSESQGRRAQSAARRVAAEQPRQLRPREAKSPTKKKTTTPTGKVPTRKVATEPATHRSRSPARSATRLTKTSTSFIGKSLPNSHGMGRVSAASFTVSSSSASFSRSPAVPSPSPSLTGRPSPPQLRSRAIAKHIEQLQLQQQQQKLSPKAKAAAKGAPEGWRVVETVKATPAAIGRQIGKLSKSLRGGPRPLLKRTGAHLRRHWHFWLSLLLLLLLGFLLLKFQREVLANVQQMRKQLVEFVNEQYEQKRQIFGDQWQRAMQTMEWARQKYLVQQQQIPPTTPPNSAIPSDKK